MRKIYLAFLLGMLCLFPSIVFASSNYVCMSYFTGVGCPHCAKTDPVLIGLLRDKPNLVILEYEIYQQRDNAPLLDQNCQNYDLPYCVLGGRIPCCGIPLVVLGKKNIITGDTPILNNLDKITSLSENPCPLIDGSYMDFDDLNITNLPGKPKIWVKDRILIRSGEGGNNKILKDLLTTSNLSSVLSEIEYSVIRPKPVSLSGKEVYFDNAIRLEGWIFQWNGEGTKTNGNDSQTSTENQSQENRDKNGKDKETKLTLAKIVSLALVDSINPCALAVLTLMLIAILTYNPKKKSKVLLAGLSFTLSVFIMYLLYGLVIIKFFQVVQTLTEARLYLYKILGVVAIVLGILEIKDFVRYKPGGFATEMPLSLRPKVKKLISGVTSPVGAFVVGLFVTVFLLPCTIGPYVIAGGILSVLEFVKIIPLLLLYNFIFVLPMILITFIVYVGFAKVEDVSGWKKKNVKKLHLIAGIIMLVLGMAISFGLL